MCSEDVAVRTLHLGKRYPRGRHPWQLIWRALWNRPVGQGSEEGFTALEEVSFEVPRGTTFGIVGRNGAGKSTLLQILCGTLHPSSGSVEVKGRIAALLELGAGFNPDFTGRENVYLNAGLHGLDRRTVDARMADIEAFAEIGDFIDQPVRTYSSGMFVRLAFAVLAHVDADVLIIDEALAVGDAYFTQKCMRFLHRFREHGTLLFVSHDTAAVMALCSQAVWLEGGRVRQIGTAKSVCESYLAALFASEERQNENSDPLQVPDGVRDWHDPREAWLNASNLRNDLQVFHFRPDALRFGAGAARILDVCLYDETGRPLAWMVGGEPAVLEIRLESVSMLRSPIVGFFVKDKLGQTLFGENTYLFSRPGPMEAGGVWMARFEFSLPYLPAGDYSVAVAVADGTPEDHVQHDWIHDALFIRSNVSAVGTGLVGLPMRQVQLQRFHP